MVGGRAWAALGHVQQGYPRVFGQTQATEEKGKGRNTDKEHRKRGWAFSEEAGLPTRCIFCQFSAELMTCQG